MTADQSMRSGAATAAARDAAIKRLKARRDVRSLLGVLVLVGAITTVVWFATGSDGHFWPMWPMLGIGIAVLVAAWQAYGPGERPITEEEIQREMSGR